MRCVDTGLCRAAKEAQAADNLTTNTICGAVPIIAPHSLERGLECTLEPTLGGVDTYRSHRTIAARVTTAR